MRDAMNLAHQKVIYRTWNRKTVESYLRTEFFLSSLMKELCEFVINAIDTNPFTPFPVRILPPIMQYDTNF